MCNQKIFLKTVCENEDIISLVWLLYRGNLPKDQVLFESFAMQCTFKNRTIDPPNLCHVFFVLLYNYSQTGKVNIDNADKWQNSKERKKYLDDIRNHYLENISSHLEKNDKKCLIN